MEALKTKIIKLEKENFDLHNVNKDYYITIKKLNEREEAFAAKPARRKSFIQDSDKIRDTEYSNKLKYFQNKLIPDENDVNEYNETQ